MRQFGTECVAQLLDQVLFHLAQAGRSHEEEAVHKLRVSIRRLQQALRLFGPYVKQSQAKRIRKRLREILQAAAEVRNRDIALKLLGRAAGAAHVVERLETERRDSVQRLHALLRTEARRSGKWRQRLELGS